MHEHFTPPVVGITMGDPSGIGPEVCLKALLKQEVCAVCKPVVFGDASVLGQTSKQLGLSIALKQISSSDLVLGSDISFGGPATHSAFVVDFENDAHSFATGKVSQASGAASVQYVESAIKAAQIGLIDAVVTGPINKLSWDAAGVDYPGHTELFADRTATDDYCMLQYSPIVSCSFATTHCGYLEVADLLTVERLVKVIQLTHDAFIKIIGRRPSLLVCGLNPHAGEDGLFGNQEEERLIVPAVEAALSSGIDVSGPLPPDTCFIPKRREEFDCVICMYHDQGHIPLKALAFDQAVNTTLGLPIIRTSVDHGTAFDIVGNNVADPSSLVQAVKLAAKLAVEPKASVVPKPNSKLLGEFKSRPSVQSH